MKTLIASIAVVCVLFGWIFLSVQKRRPSLNKGWAVLAFACACGALTLGAAKTTMAALDAGWWRAVGFGLLFLVGLIAGSSMLWNGDGNRPTKN
jgi:hypothetical protein